MKNNLKPFSVFLQSPLKFEQRKSFLSKGYFLDTKKEVFQKVKYAEKYYHFIGSFTLLP